MAVMLFALLFGVAGCSAAKSGLVAPEPFVRSSPPVPQDHTDLASPLPSQSHGMQLAFEPALGLLSPTPNLLPSTTVSVTLALTTAVPARCRWSEKSGTLYELMPHEFQQGQGTIAHSTVANGLRPLDDRRFYVRCQDLVAGRNPDSEERQTHLRVLGRWDGGYPRIANVYSDFQPEWAQLFAGYDLFIPYQLSNPVERAATIRTINPNAKILRSQNATYGWPGGDPLTTEWWNSQPGDLGYNCLLRDSHRKILFGGQDADHPFYNLTQPFCRAVLVQSNVEEFLSSQSDLGASLAFDGIYWDWLEHDITWLRDDIDSDLDGHPDDPEILNAAYRAGVEDLITQVRARLPHVILTGNGAAQVYAPWINGRLYEAELPAILNGAAEPAWYTTVADYQQWAGSGQAPHTTFIFSAPEPIYRQKHDSSIDPHILPAFQAEAAASYQRMRFGLTTALMGDGLFFYDLRTVEGIPAWYDEFGIPPGGAAAALPPRGYLGRPASDPYLLVDELNTPDQILNGDLEDGLNHWRFWANTGAGAAATVDIDPHGGVSGSAAAHLTITSATKPWDVLLSQYDRTTVATQSYTLSFWARSDMPRAVVIALAKQDPPGTNYGFRFEVLVTPQWQHFHLPGSASVTADDGQLTFAVGGSSGEIWLDEVQLRAGALGVWARTFEHGLAVINSTREVQTVQLPGVYCKLRGTQAPLFQARVDDDEAKSSAGWNEQVSDRRQFGATVHVAPGGAPATMTYTPILAFDGEYEVLAWVAPDITQSRAASVSIRHANGESTVLLDEAVGEVGWHSLGTYYFSAGGTGYAMLTAAGSGTVIADAFKWVSTARYNDGSQVSQITLQPQDGRVLLASCWEPTASIHLPIIWRD